MGLWLLCRQVRRGVCMSTEKRPSESVWNDGENMADQIKGLLSLLRDVALSGHTEVDPRLSYVEVQIDVDTWRRITGMFPTTANGPSEEAK